MIQDLLPRFAKALWIGSLGTFAFSAYANDDPEATTRALRRLLAIADAPIPKTSTCFGDYLQAGPAKVADLLAVELAYLYSGENVIKGGCEQNRCAISITHSAGEDVSSAEIRFSLRRGKAQASSLQCVITP